MRQQDLADRCDLTRSSIANIEAGRQQPTVTALLRLAEALETGIGVLAGVDPMPELSRIPVVRVVREYVIVCELHGEVDRSSDSKEAYRIRRRHSVPHLDGQLE
jgi:transcriptional regulator with XRE-family HTH domain